MSTKQLAWSVRRGSMIRISIPTGVGRIVGYLCGMDDFHLMVVDQAGDKHLIHKASALITFLDEPTYDREPRRDLLETVVAPFREAILTHVFGEQR